MCAVISAVAQLTVVRAGQADMSLPWEATCWAPLPTLPLVQEALLAMLICSTGSAVRGLISLAFLAGVVARMAFVLKTEFSHRTVGNTATSIKNPCHWAPGAVLWAGPPA